MTKEITKQMKHFAAIQRIEWMFQFKCDFLDFNSITIEVAASTAATTPIVVGVLVVSKLEYPNIHRCGSFRSQTQFANFRDL